MVSYVFDSSAALHFLDDEAGSDRVEELIKDRALSSARLLICAVQWGEVAGNVCKRRGPNAVRQTLDKLATLSFEPIPVSPEHAVRAAMLRIDFGLPYADTMLAALALAFDQAVLITADFDFKVVEHLLTIEFLPAKQPLPPTQP